MTISEKSWVSLSLVIAIAGGILAAGIWVGAVNPRITAVEAAVKKVEEKHEDAMKEFRGMNKTLGEILGELRQISRRK